GTERKTLGHIDATRIEYLPKGDRFLSAGSDGFVRLWDAKREQPVLSLVSFASGDYVAITPERYYSASRGALQGVSFRSGMNAYSFDQFDLKYNRPDLVLKAIDRAPAALMDAYANAARKRLARMGVDESQLADQLDQLPQLSLT